MPILPMRSSEPGIIIETVCLPKWTRNPDLAQNTASSIDLSIPVGGMNMQTDEIHVGQIFVGVVRPRHEWRVIRQNNESVELERVDKQSVLRFVSAADLSDANLYVWKG